MPFNPMMGPPPPGMNPIRDLVNVPGILLITYGALGIAYALFGLVMNVVAGDANAAQMDSVLRDPNLPPAVKDVMRTFAGSGGKVIQILVNLLSMGLGALIAFGGFQMRNLKSHGLAFAACIAAMLPCTCCCLLGLPLGIWGIATLTKPEVKAAFS